MELFDLKNMIKGWFIGNFEPTTFKTDLFEIAIKKYKAGDEEKEHFHKIAKEFTIIISGIVSFNNIEYFEDDIVIIEQNEKVKFKSITDSKTLVIKIPSSINDKYEI
jgi:hypothetical protein